MKPQKMFNLNFISLILEHAVFYSVVYRFMVFQLIFNYHISNSDNIIQSVHCCRLRMVHRTVQVSRIEPFSFHPDFEMVFFGCKIWYRNTADFKVKIIFLKMHDL